MFRITSAAVLLAIAAQTAHAHFVFVVPDPKDSAKAVVVLSEELEADDNVSVGKLAAVKLVCRDGNGKEEAVECKEGEHALTAVIPEAGPRVVFGALNYGVMRRGDAKPFLIAYYPKAVIGAVRADKLVLGEKKLPVELIPVVSGSEVRFRFLAAGKPAADATVTVIRPGGGTTKAQTDKDGLTQPFPAKGRYGAWAKDVLATPGEFGGKKYDEVRRYATLVFGLPEAPNRGGAG